MIEEYRFLAAEACAEAAANAIAEALREAIADRGHASLAVSGGRTAECVFPYLSIAELAWRRVAITLTDDRWVEPGHPDSNEGLARRFLMRDRAARAALVGLKSAETLPHDGLEVAESRLATINWPLDVVFLGMGTDGHIASLFPDDPNWTLGSGRVVAVSGVEGRHPRMSLSPSALRDARYIVLVVIGAGKAEALAQARVAGPLSAAPARLVLDQPTVPVSVFACT